MSSVAVIQINKQVSAYRHHVCMRLCVPCCVCVRARGGFSESIGCDGGGCSVSLSCCDAEAGSQSEITGRLAAGVCEPCVFVCASFYLHLTLLTDGDVVSSSPPPTATSLCFLLTRELHNSSSIFILVVFVDTTKTCAHRCNVSKTLALNAKSQ